jgi:hypothetical protein
MNWYWLRVLHRSTMALLLGFGLVNGVAEVAAYEVDQAASGATVRGHVTFRGALPSVNRIPVQRDRAFCGETMRDEAMLVDQASKGIAGVVVSLEGVTKGKPLEITPMSLDNAKCRFHPHVGAAATGSQLEIKNADPVLHNTHIRKDGATFLNIALPPHGKPIRKPLANVGQLDVRCDAHKFMQASIHVFDHPYFAVTDEAGRFELAKVPSGTYRLRIWHEILGMQEQTIQVPDKGMVTINPMLEGQR